MAIKLKTLLTTAHSISFLIDDGGYFSTNVKYEISLNDTSVITTDKCVNSVFDLEPGRKYEIRVRNAKENEEATLLFETSKEFLTVNVRDLGAYGDGIHNDTEFIQAAIMCCPENSRVLIPEGRYLINSIFLKSGVNIEFSKGAVLVADTDRSTRVKFPGSIITSETDNDEYHLGTWEGEPAPMYAGIITGIGVRDINIYGEGIIDGGADFDNWWNNPKKLNVAYRPRLIFLSGCSNISLQGVMLTNSPSWTVHPFFCNSLRFVDMRIENPADSPNTDGIDPESCEDVEIAGVEFNLGDDCIAVKSGKIYMGQKYKKPSDRINIHHCLMKNGHGAVTLGSEIAGGVSNVLVEKCLFVNTDRGLRIKTRRGRGKQCFLNNIVFRKIKMQGVLNPFTANMFYFCDPDGHSEYVQSRSYIEKDDRTPRLGELIFEDIEAVDAHVCAGYFLGLPESPIDSVVMKNVSITFSTEPKEGVPVMCDGVGKMSGVGIVAENVLSLRLENVRIEGCEGRRITTDNVGTLIDEEK